MRRWRRRRARASTPSPGRVWPTSCGGSCRGRRVELAVVRRPAVLEFFSTSTRNLLEAEAVAGVGHHVAMSVVGADRLPDSGYLRAKVAQETLIADSSIPYSIVRATQFFEFIDSIAAAATEGDTVRVSPMLIQPMAVGDVARAVGKVSVGAPLNATIEIGGPGDVPARRARSPCPHRPSRPAPHRR